MNEKNENSGREVGGFWTCNIDRRGRWMRLLAGLAMLGAAVWLWMARDQAFWACGLIAMGLLAVFESLRGWCIMRAFGFKTPV